MSGLGLIVLALGRFDVFLVKLPRYQVVWTTRSSIVDLVSTRHLAKARIFAQDNQALRLLARK